MGSHFKTHHFDPWIQKRRTALARQSLDPQTALNELVLSRPDLTPQHFELATAFSWALTKGDFRPLRIGIGEIFAAIVFALSAYDLRQAFEIIRGSAAEISWTPYMRAFVWTVSHVGLPTSPQAADSEVVDELTGLSSLKLGMFNPRSRITDAMRVSILTALNYSSDDPATWWTVWVQLGLLPSTGG